MSGLVGKTIKAAYKSLLRVDDDSNGIDSTAEVITDGSGNKSALNLSTNSITVNPQTSNGSSTLLVRDIDSTVVFGVDTSDKEVKAGATQSNVLTQYAYFGANNIDTAAFADDTHMALPFNGLGYGDLSNIPSFGTTADPATTFTTSDGSGTKASDLTTCIWHVQDNITIDAVTAFVGADTATTDSAARIHLMSYTFSSGSTSALTSGDLVAYSPSDINNLGNEQIYRQGLTIDTSGNDVNANKVILAFYRSDSINSDFSLNITVKYHLR